ncbi:ArsR family transcriptional regulator [Fulvivirga sp. M361]|uniref:ArsR family transcriptional regulator n=1 Tax=Fulvivirga sp. M361 TaxID=2594266 RepID=UPI00117AF7EE|nr:ArsR family transcriptional regulator [Fulvivirga sp. M361]TRX50211.1 ArsR family transcriptional regulator [Fulvivirga sp. M361]
MIDTLITSKTRIKLLLKFFLNPQNTSYLRGLEAEFGESSNAIRTELNRLEKSNMLLSVSKGNRKMFKVNDRHPLYNEINSIVRKYLGIDLVIEFIVNKLGHLHSVYLIGQLARGIDSPVIDLVLVGNVDKVYLIQLIDKAEKLINRKIKFMICDQGEEDTYLAEGNLLIWNND